MLLTADCQRSGKNRVAASGRGKKTANGILVNAAAAAVFGAFLPFVSKCRLMVLDHDEFGGYLPMCGVLEMGRLRLPATSCHVQNIIHVSNARARFAQICTHKPASKRARAHTHARTHRPIQHLQAIVLLGVAKSARVVNMVSEWCK